MDHDVARVDNDRPKLREFARRRNKPKFDVLGVLFVESLGLLERSDVRGREHCAVGQVDSGEAMLDPRGDLLVGEIFGRGEL